MSFTTIAIWLMGNPPGGTTAPVDGACSVWWAITCLLSIGSQQSDRVERRSCALGQPQRFGDDHELPALLLLACRGHVLEIQAVGHEHAHRRHLQRVDGIEDAV